MKNAANETVAIPRLINKSLPTRNHTFLTVFFFIFNIKLIIIPVTKVVSKIPIETKKVQYNIHCQADISQRPENII